MSRIADFSQPTKDKLAKKVGYHCSNPFCRKSTIGANTDGSGTINIGEAAHITAAEPGGPRYDASLTNEQRKSESNGIWLCRNHAAMIDRDESFFTVDLLRSWKTAAEKEANECLQDIIPPNSLQYDLRVLYDDLVTCCATINDIIQIDRIVVVAPSRFPVPSEYEKKIESVVNVIGMNYGSRIRRCFMSISNFRDILEEEYSRTKNRFGIIADMRAISYSHQLQRFLFQMKEYDIYELVKTIGELFEHI